MRLWQMRTRVKIDTLEPLVWKIALNLTAKRRRWLRLRRFFGLDPQGQDSRPLPDQTIAELQRQTSIRKAVDDLPSDLRSVITLTAFSELSYEQVSEILEIPAGTVASRRNRAIALLKSTLVTDA